MSLGRLRRKRSHNDLLFFFSSVTLIVFLFICFISMKNDCIFMKNEIHHLNRLVVDYCGKEVGSNVLQYQTYLKDIENLPQVMDLPAYTHRSRPRGPIPYPLASTTTPPNAFHLKRRIKAQFPTGFRLMSVPPSSMKKLGLGIGKSI